MKHVHFFSIVLLLSSASQTYTINVSQQELEIQEKMGIIAGHMLNLKCANQLFAPESKQECERLDASRLSLVDELHKAINARKEAIEEALQVPAEETTVKETLTNLIDKYSYSGTAAEEVKEAVVMLEPAHSTSGDLA